MIVVFHSKEFTDHSPVEGTMAEMPSSSPLFQFLPVPELMPFRLTRQLRNLMLPLQEKGLIEGTMIHALRALRSNKEMLISMLDIFIKEPSLDWEVSQKAITSGIINQ